MRLVSNIIHNQFMKILTVGSKYGPKLQLETSFIPLLTLPTINHYENRPTGLKMYGNRSFVSHCPNSH